MWRKLPIFLILLVSLSLIFSSIVYYATSKPPTQPFMSFGLYSAQGLQGYIPNTNLTITPLQTINWTIAVGNMMNTAQFAMVVVRLANMTTQNATSTSPAATVPELSAMQLFLGVGQTSQLKFSWTLLSANQTGKLVFVNLSINGAPTAGQLQIGASLGHNFRLIFELWTYDTASESFQYGYPGMQSTTIGEWLQVWFNAPG